MGFHIGLDLERLAEGMLGNPGWVGNYDPERGEVDEFRFTYGRDGRLRNDHPYISAVAIVHERDLTAEYRNAWREEWKKGREPLDPRSYDEPIREWLAEEREWHSSGAAAAAPRGSAYWIELLTTLPGHHGATRAVGACGREPASEVEIGTRQHGPTRARTASGSGSR
jgi:hypothetical protein